MDLGLFSLLFIIVSLLTKKADLDADIVYRTVMATSELAAGEEDAGPIVARVERAVLAMVGV